MNAELIRLASGKRYALEKQRTLIGRSPGSDIVVEEPYTSRKHCAVARDAEGFLIEDCRSSNGTFINGKKIGNPVRLRDNDIISLGKDECAFRFSLTLGFLDRVKTFLRRPLHAALIGGGAVLLIGLAVALPLLLRAPEPGRPPVDIEQGLRRLERIHGAAAFPKDPAFHSAVSQWVDRVVREEAQHPTVEHRRRYGDMIESIVADFNLPIDYSFIAWAESRYEPTARNPRSGAAGMWQLLPSTARAYGLKVGRGIDERLDPELATQAASRYLSDLVSMFGRDSFLLVLCAYNAGDNAVLYGLKQIQDPVNDRNFWYLYSHDLIPRETKQYVLKVVALIIAADALDS